jgi:deoxyribodipyrimidine photo-lyase
MPEIADQLAARGVPLVVRLGSPEDVIPALVAETRPAMLVVDENPTRLPSGWRSRIAVTISVPFRLVDADVVVPTSLLPKQEYAALTIRPKIHCLLADYLKPIPNPPADHPAPPALVPTGEPLDPNALLDRLRVGGVGEVPDYVGGPAEAWRRLRRFLRHRLAGYSATRNEPTPYSTSERSVHLHFGHISPLTVALAVRESGAPAADIDAFLEALIVRRELAINFVTRNPRYDSLAGCPSWAIQSLAKHRTDPREFLYSAAALERGETQDSLWNAAQKEMLLTGRMHNYLRMYWAKKILE